MNLPRRSRAHQLEALSRTAFRAALDPLGWVVRNVDSEADYGIDLEVEIFGDDVDGHRPTTGLTFKVQVRGTESAGSSGPYRDVKVDHLNYWSSLAVPVLLVLHVADTNEIFLKWVHAFDRGPNPRGTKTQRIRMTVDDLLVERLPRLRDEVELLGSLGTGHVSLPIPVRVDMDSPVELAAFAAGLRDFIHARGLRDIARVVGTEWRAVSVKVHDRGLRVALPIDAQSQSLHTASGYRKRENWENVFGDVLAAIAVLAAKLGATSVAVRVLRRVAPLVRILDDAQTMDVVAYAARQERAPDVVIAPLLLMCWIDRALPPGGCLEFRGTSVAAR